MNRNTSYLLLADVVLTLHAALVLFVVGGLVMVVVGNLLRWQWVNSLWFRLAHLAVILVVLAESWLGIACPLTTLENWLRVQAGALPYESGFIVHWLQRLIYYDAPSWVFTVAYSLFALAVVAAWIRFPPRKRV